MTMENKTPSKYAELIAHLEVVGWEADGNGDAVCVNVGAAMAADTIRDLETKLRAAEQALQDERDSRARDKVTHDLDLQGKMLEAAADRLRKAEQAQKEAKERLAAANKELEGYRAYARGINEALNSGDGVYRP